MAKTVKPKKVAYELIPERSDVGRPLYARLERLLQAHHGEISGEGVRIALAWATSWHPDVDGRLTLGKCKRATDLDRELAPYDFVILLNRDFWQDARVSEVQRDALLDHELCHAGIAYDANGEPKVDTRRRTVFRTVKHSIEEFIDVVDRHGCYKADLEAFARALRRQQPSGSSTFVGFQSVRDRLLAAGLDVPLLQITEWSEQERRDADTWARLDVELQHSQQHGEIEVVCPAHVLAAAVNLSVDDDPRGETWQTIPEYPDYDVSSRGRVRRTTSRTSGRAGHILRQPLRSGYPSVDLSRDGRKKTHHVHRLVAEAFVTRVEGADEVNHRDGVRTNNDFENLEWMTRAENQQHAYRLGLQDAAGEKNGFAKLTEAEVLRIRELAGTLNRPSYQTIADMFGVTESNIRAIVSGRSWSAASPTH
jgi:hypothetical protein